MRGIIMDEISSFGDNWIDVEVKVPSTGKMSFDNVQGLARGVSITSLTRKDMEAIGRLDNIGNVYSCLAFLIDGTNVSFLIPTR